MEKSPWNHGSLGFPSDLFSLAMLKMQVGEAASSKPNYHDATQALIWKVLVLIH